jgi:hypothetical protein
VRLTTAQQKELSEIFAELAKELGMSRRELFGEITKAGQSEGLRPENN